jgi:hypothetical protein
MGTTSEQLTAIDELRAQAQRISELETQLRETQRDLINARQHEKAIRLDERIKTTGLIEQAMENGSLSKEAPSSGRHWLDAFWLHGYNMAQLRKNYRTAADQRRRLANDFDTVLDDLRPAFELILANRENFGADLGLRLAPIINDFFLRAYAAEPEKAEQPATIGGHEFHHFTRSVTCQMVNGTRVRVGTTDDEAVYGIELTTHVGLPTEHTTSLGIKRDTLNVALELVGILTGLNVPGVGVVTYDDGRAMIETLPRA